MELIDEYLKNQPNLSLEDLRDDEAKLEFFFNLFIDLENRYASKIEDIKRINQEHKEEMSQLQISLLRVKELTEEREHLNFREENEELKNKISYLEKELESLQYEYELCLKNIHDKNKQDTPSDDEELSESTIEMLVLEGFGKIVQAPTHEKIAVILADRANLIAELNNLKSNLNQENQNQNKDEDEDENENEQIFDSLKTQIEELRHENDSLKQKLNEFEHETKLKKTLEVKESEYENVENEHENENSTSESTSTAEQLYKFEISKLKEENLNLKNEVEKLYDEIGTFEIELKQFREENNNLKQEIECLNNELDELIQFKANYDRLKKEYDKLSSSLKQYEKNLNEKLNSPRTKPNLTPTQSFSSIKQEEKVTKSPQLELDWIRGENEKLLLDLEKTQNKLNDKINQYNDLKQQIVDKDEQMKEFIKKYEQKETTEDDLLQSKKKLLEIENLLSIEKEEHLKSIESGEDRLRDVLKRNDQLYSQMTDLEQSYDDCVNMIKEQSLNIENLNSKNNQNEIKIKNLTSELETELDLNKVLVEKNTHLEKIKQDLEMSLEMLKNEMKNENEANKNEIEKLNENLEILDNKFKLKETEVFDQKMEIESLNKEKLFIISQNEAHVNKIMQDYLTLQEKYTSANFELNKSIKDLNETKEILKEKNDSITNLEAKKNILIKTLEQESEEKLNYIEKCKKLDSALTKNNEKIEELNDKINQLESKKQKLEFKLKDLDTLQSKYDQLNNELNDKRETLSQALEKSSKQEQKISNLEQQLNETKHLLIQTETQITELTQFKSDALQRIEENIKLKHDLENEKLRREKSDLRINEFKDEFKKIKQKFLKIQQENAELRHENIEVKNQLSGFKSKLDMITDKSHTELEKNSALQDELSETKKKLELVEVKCANYGQKFDLLMKKYEARKAKHKNKIERLWDYLQREKSKYKDLLANAQSDLNMSKNFDRQDSTYHQLIEEKAKLVSEIAEKDSKMRELKRQNFQLQSKIKLLEQEAENLNDKIETVTKEKNKFRKELHLKMMPSVTSMLDLGSSANNSPESSSPEQPKLIDQYDSFYLKSDSLNLNYWNELNTSSSWDVYYNTGNIHKYNKEFNAKIESLNNTPRSFR